MDFESKVNQVETIESLTKEAEILKKKLEDERQKLNDVTCKIYNMCSCYFSNKYIFSGPSC